MFSNHVRSFFIGKIYRQFVELMKKVGTAWHISVGNICVVIILLECCHNFWSGGTEGTKFADRAPLTFNCSRPSCSSVYYIRNDRLVISRRPHFDSNTISVKVYKKTISGIREKWGRRVGRYTILQKVLFCFNPASFSNWQGLCCSSEGAFWHQH